MGAHDQTALLVVAVAAAVLVVVLLAALRSTRRTRRRLDAAQAEAEELRARLESLSARLDERPVRSDEVEFVITDAGDVVATEDLTAVPDRLVLSATLGEPLVKVAAFGHGVRRALSAESRNRIWFEMRREVRATRKRRRREMKSALRQARAGQRSATESGDGAAVADSSVDAA